MKGLILSLILGTSTVAATNDNVQEFTRGQFQGFTNSIHMKFNKNITEEMQELMNYKIDLMQEYDFENMTEEEIVNAREEIIVKLQEKAEELGVELPQRGFMNSKVRFELTEEMKALADYAKELHDGYDFDNMTEEEILVAREEIRTKVEEKAELLGVEMPYMFKNFDDEDFGYRQKGRQSRQGRFGYHQISEEE